MIGAVPVEGYVAAGNYRAFLDAYPDPEHRQHAAGLLLRIEDDNPRYTESDIYMLNNLRQYPTRTVLTALRQYDEQELVKQPGNRLAEEEYELYQTARFLYDLKNTADRYIGQTVMSFTTGSPEDVRSRDQPPKRPLFIDIGTLASSYTAYEFPPTLHVSDAESDDNERNFLNIRVSLPVRDARMVSVDPSGESSVVPYGTKSASIPALTGRVLVGGDQADYLASREVHCNELVFGNNASARIINRLPVSVPAYS